jgi:hypothetical protein
MQAGLQRRRGELEVQVVRRHDRHQPRRRRRAPLGGDHLAPVGVGARAPGPALRGRLARIAAEGAGHQGHPPVQLGGHAVHRADEGARAAAHHGEPDGTGLGHATTPAR